jgi:hypothetical protein
MSFINGSKKTSMSLSACLGLDMRVVKKNTFICGTTMNGIVKRRIRNSRMVLSSAAMAWWWALRAVC